MCNWIRERVEAPQTEWSKEERLQMLDRMTFAETFEKFLGLKYGSHKRFGLDGCEALIPGAAARGSCQGRDGQGRGGVVDTHAVAVHSQA